MHSPTNIPAMENAMNSLWSCSEFNSAPCTSFDFFKNPFTDTLALYGNTGGSKSSNQYTLPIRNADGMYLDSNDNELYVILRYKGNPTPVTGITLTFS